MNKTYQLVPYDNDPDFRKYLTSFGSKFRELRTLRLGCSQDRLGYFMNLSQSEVSRIEHGQRMMNIFHLRRLKSLVPELDMNDLFGDCGAIDILFAGRGTGNENFTGRL